MDNEDALISAYQEAYAKTAELNKAHYLAKRNGNKEESRKLAAKVNRAEKKRDEAYFLAKDIMHARDVAKREAEKAAQRAAEIKMANESYEAAKAIRWTKGSPKQREFASAIAMNMTRDQAF